MANYSRLRGLRALVEDVVEHGSSAVERVHLATAARPFVVLEHIPATATVARGVHVAHDTVATTVYRTIRAANRLVGTVAGVAIDMAEALDGQKDEP
jgi:hypothetical protein